MLLLLLSWKRSDKRTVNPMQLVSTFLKSISYMWELKLLWNEGARFTPPS